MPTTIEQLELEIQSSSTSAISGIDALSASLSKLKSATKGGIGLTSIANQVRNLDSALKSMDGSGADKISKLSASLEKLRNLGNIKISSSIGNQLKNIGNATAALTDSDFSGIKKISESLASLNTLNKPTGLNSVVNTLGKLPQLSQSLNSMNWGTFTSQIQQLTSSLSPLASQIGVVNTAFNCLPSSMQRVAAVTNKLTQENTHASGSYVNLWAKISIAKNVVSRMVGTLASWITQSNQYIEDVNLFTVSMGQYAAEAQNYAEQVSEVLGIDPGEFMRSQGVFNTIISGFGVASDKAYLMSKNLTQLGYDIASFFNIPFENAMEKLQSGISGELEPLRRLGYDLSVARLQEEALTLGITKNVSEMTQAEKSQLRYYAIMTQVTTAQGDMARTLNAPANQLRVLQAQVTQCARALGNIFIPVLNAVLPYAIALAKVIRMLASVIAGLFGFKLPKVDYSGISVGASAMGDLANNAGSASDGLGKTAKGLGDTAKAAKKLKNAMIGIDELNVISPDDSSSGSGTGGAGGSGGGLGGLGGGDLGIDLPAYDFLGDAITAKVDEIVQMIKDAMWEITSVISGFLLAVGTILVVTGANIPLGIGLMAVGAIGLAAAIVTNWNGMSERLVKVLTLVTSILGGFLLAIGAFLLFSGANVPLGAGLMAAGAIALGTAATINWKFLNGDLSNALSIITAIVSGALLAMGALFAFTGVDVPLGIALMVAGAVGLATAIGLNWDSMSCSMRKAIGTLEAIIGGALLTFGAILALSGTNAPLGIAMIAVGAVSLVSAVALNWNALTGDTKKSIGTITAILSGSLIGVGAILALTGVAIPLGVAMIAAGAVGIVATAGLNWGSLTGKIKKVLKAIGIAVGAAFIAIGAILALTGVAVPLGVAFIAAGAASLIAGVALNWESIVGKIKDVLKKIAVIVGTASLALGVILCLTGVNIPLGLGLIVAGASSLTAAGVIDWNVIQKKVSDGLKSISDKFKSFKDSVSEKLNNTKDEIKNWASNVKEWFTSGEDGKNIVDHFKDTAKNLVDGFKKSVSSEYTSTKTSIITWGSSVKTWFSDNVNKESFAEFAKNIVDGFKNKVDSDHVNSKSALTNWATKVKAWFSDTSFGGVNSQNFQKYATDIIEGFKNKVGSTYTSTKPHMVTWGNSVKSWFSAIVTGSVFATFAADIVDGFKNKISNYWSTAKTTMGTFANGVISAFKLPNGKSIIESFKTIGKNIIQGFIDGVNSLWNIAMERIREFGRSIISAGKKGTDEHSPSRAFKKIGAFVVEGFNIGIDNMIPSSYKMMDKWMEGINAYQPSMKLAVDTSSLRYYDSKYFVRDVSTSVNASADIDNNFKEEMIEFYKEYLEQQINGIVDNTRKQAENTTQSTPGISPMMSNNRNESSSGLDVKVYLDGKQITAAVEKRQRERGATIYSGGVL
jgi:hypothetical protein